MKKSVLTAILLSGFLVGTADILLAFANAYIQKGTTPDKVLRFIASGVFDKKAFVAADAAMIFYGLLFHYIIATLFTAAFYFIYPKIKWLSANKIITGVLYGIVVWAAMYFIIVPLSNTPGSRKFELTNVLLAITILIVAIGLPLSYLANKFYTVKQKETNLDFSAVNPD